MNAIPGSTTAAPQSNSSAVKLAGRAKAAARPGLARAGTLLALAVALAVSCGKGSGDAGGAASDGAPQGGAALPVLRIGLEPQYPPFEMTNEQGTCIGFDVDLATAAAKALGREPKFLPLAFDALLPELQAGRIDVICSGMSWMKERAEKVSFSRPYVRIRMGVLVSGVAATRIQNFEDLNDSEITVAVQRGTSGESKARERFPKAKIVPFDNEVDAGNEVAAGRATAFVYDMVSVKKLAEKAGTKVRVMDGDLGTEVYCMAFAKGSELVAPTDRFLEDASKPGGLLSQLMTRWQPAAELIPPGSPPPGSPDSPKNGK